MFIECKAKTRQAETEIRHAPNPGTGRETQVRSSRARSFPRSVLSRSDARLLSAKVNQWLSLAFRYRERPNPGNDRTPGTTEPREQPNPGKFGLGACLTERFGFGTCLSVLHFFSWSCRLIPIVRFEIDVSFYCLVCDLLNIDFDDIFLVNLWKGRERSTLRLVFKFCWNVLNGTTR